MSKECLDFINEASTRRKIINRVYGLRKNGGCIDFLMLPINEEKYWWPCMVMSPTHSELLDSWIKSGGDIENYVDENSLES